MKMPTGQRLRVVSVEDLRHGQLRLGQMVVFRSYWEGPNAVMYKTSAGIFSPWRFKPVVRVKMGRKVL